MQFRVEGADSTTARERWLVIEAVSMADAEELARAQGMLISSTRAIAENEARDPLEQLAAAASTSPPVKTMGYATPPPTHQVTERIVPEYVGLQIGKIVLLVCAIIYYLVAAYWIAVAILLFVGTSPLVTRQNSSVALASIGAFTAAGCLFFAVLFVSLGGLFHAASAACAAMRDIGRNSFRH